MLAARLKLQRSIVPIFEHDCAHTHSSAVVSATPYRHPSRQRVLTTDLSLKECRLPEHEAVFDLSCTTLFRQEDLERFAAGGVVGVAAFSGESRDTRIDELRFR